MIFPPFFAILYFKQHILILNYDFVLFLIS